MSRYEELNRQVTAVVLEAKLAGASSTLIKSEKRQHVDSRGNPTFEPSTEVGILESLRQDVYLVLARRHRRGDRGDSHHVQPARVVGLVRRHHHGDRRAHRDVAAGHARGREASRGRRLRGGHATGGARARGRRRVMASRREFLLALGGTIAASTAGRPVRSAAR